ncbi:hypothetical protein KKC60_04390 [Patescibacteria group bacterium]|nr:hypothetical protein [Patescibacteria group bacterium]
MELDSKQAFDKIEETFQDLRGVIAETKRSDSALLECFVLAQVFDNEKRYIREFFPIEANTDEYTRLANLEKAAGEEYKQLFPVYDRLSTQEVVDLIYTELQKIVPEYQKRMDYFGDMDLDKLIETLELRDRIKLLFDELEVWTNRFVRKDRIELERQDDLFKQITETDTKLKDELVVKSSTHKDIYMEAESRLIRKPNGKKRYDFWWWHAGE